MRSLNLALIQATDHDLIALAASGSEKAYRELLDRYQRPVFSLIYRMVRDREKAEDLAQETFVKVFNHIDSFNPKYKFSSWIFKIASNLTIDAIRKKDLDTVSLDGSRNASTPDEVDATRITVESRRAGHAPPVVIECRGTSRDAVFSELIPLVLSNAALAARCLSRYGPVHRPQSADALG